MKNKLLKLLKGLMIFIALFALGFGSAHFFDSWGEIWFDIEQMVCYEKMQNM
jgi:hypothetical protein